MKEIRYKYNTLGSYTTEEGTSFGQESHLKLIVEPHDFSIAIGGAVLRNTTCDGYAAVVSRQGEVVFYDNAGNSIAQANQGEKNYTGARLVWQPDSLSVQFGCVHTVDHYPNCDGEHDRWSEEWVAERTVTLNLSDHSVKIK